MALFVSSVESRCCIPDTENVTLEVDFQNCPRIELNGTIVLFSRDQGL